MRLADLPAVLAIEAVAYSHPWTHGNFVDSLASGYLARRFSDDSGQLIGYFVAMPGVDEMHLLNLSIAPAQQRRGHGLALLQTVCELARASGAQMLWLEVRHSNTAARRLYARGGFAQIAVRRAYYPAGPGRREDAVVMNRPLEPVPHALV